ncbi:hypothetical protein V8F33_002609 [Rhypophila sp. PSN 637]
MKLKLKNFSDHTPPKTNSCSLPLDEGLDVLVLNEGLFKLNQGYSDKRVVLTLRDYIHNKITLQDASRTIREFVSGNEAGFGSCMLHTASQIPYYHPTGQPRLVQLLRDVYYDFSWGWRNQFRQTIYENSGLVIDIESDETDRVTPGDPIRQSINLVAFFARLSQDGTFDMTSHGLTTMGFLEENRDVQSADWADCSVRMAALWIILAGQRLYTQIVEAPPITKEGEEEKTVSGGTSRLYTGPVYGRARWNFWRDKLSAATDREDLSAESRDLAKNAAELMGVIDRSLSASKNMG